MTQLGQLAFIDNGGERLVAGSIGGALSEMVGVEMGLLRYPPPFGIQKNQRRERARVGRVKYLLDDFVRQALKCRPGQVDGF